MTRSLLRSSAPAAVLAAAAALLLGASPASASAPVQQRVASTTNAWPPPAGYTHQGSFFGAAACQTAGKDGVAAGEWSAYLCRQELPFSVIQELYVKK
ncbi:hypothetical protein ACH4ZU_22965 [Streptomyces sp. NPDC020472]|uniref:hypothetical protein n=1 Tax=unclassified Streptomyces TaxID=2593676 RepID=UPI003697D949